MSRPSPSYPAGTDHRRTGPYEPDARLLDILAALTGAADYAGTDAQTRHQVWAAAESIHDAGLDASVVGLVPEARVQQLQGLQTNSARTIRNRDKDFPRPVVNYRLWSEVDVQAYLDWKEANRRPDSRPPTRTRRASSKVSDN